MHPNATESHPAFRVDGLESTLAAVIEATCNPASDDALRQAFQGYALNYDVAGDALPNAGSDLYRAMVIALYERIARRAYDPDTTEMTPLDIDAAVLNPFPYATKSPGTVAMYLHMVAAVLQRFKGMPAGAKILEFGPGWGETTITLARLGFAITCLDINPQFLELIRRRAAMLRISGIRYMQGDFLAAAKITGHFDVILFFECFHHALFHREVLAACVARLAPFGQIIFAGEPIADDFPIPWGLRLEGQSLWSIASHGWMELGFSTDYFKAMLLEAGLIFIEHRSSELTFFRCFTAAKALRLDFASAPLGTQVGVVCGTAVTTTAAAGTLVYGPYWRLAQASYRLRCYCERVPDKGDIEGAVLHVWHGLATHHIASCVIEPAGVTDIIFTLDTDVTDVEFVIVVAETTDCLFRSFELTGVPGQSGRSLAPV